MQLSAVIYLTSQTMASYDFDRISAIIASKSPKIIEILEECRADKTIPPPSVLKHHYDDKFSTKNTTIAKHPATNDNSSSPSPAPVLSKVAESYKSLDHLPSCFQKPPPHRKNSNLSTTKNATHSTSKRNDSSLSPHSNGSSGSKSNFEELSSNPERIFEDFKRDETAFGRVFQTAAVRHASANRQLKENVEELRRTFGDLEKVVPPGLKESPAIFDSDIARNLESLQTNVDALVFMQENNNLYPIVERMPDDEDLDLVAELTGSLLKC